MAEETLPPLGVRPVKSSAVHADVPAAALTMLVWSLLLLFGIGFSIGEGVGLLSLGERLGSYMAKNELSVVARRVFLANGFGFAAGLIPAVALVAWFRRRRTPFVQGLWHLSRRLAPLGALGFLPMLLHPTAWRRPDLVFPALVLVAALVLETGVVSAVTAGPVFSADAPLRRFSRWLPSWKARWPRLPAGIRVTTLVVASAGYVVGMSLLASAGRPWADKEGLLVGQSALLGSAAVPLYLLARERIGPPAACVLSVLYLLYPPLHAIHLSGFHRLPLATPFVFLCAYALESRRNVLLAVAVVLAFAAHENAGLLLFAIGAYWGLAGRNRGAGLLVAGIGLGGFALAKGVILPRLGIADTTAVSTAYAALFPLSGPYSTMAGLALGNPWRAFTLLDDVEKVRYAATLLVPLAMTPMRSSGAVVLALPLMLTLLTGGRSAALVMGSEVSAWWIAPTFIAAVLSLGAAERPRRIGMLAAVSLAMLVFAFQFGAAPWRAP